jgi:hypothetical protein
MRVIKLLGHTYRGFGSVLFFEPGYDMKGMDPHMISWNLGWVWFGWELVSCVV